MAFESVHSLFPVVTCLEHFGTTVVTRYDGTCLSAGNQPIIQTRSVSGSYTLADWLRRQLALMAEQILRGHGGDRTLNLPLSWRLLSPVELRGHKRRAKDATPSPFVVLSSSSTDAASLLFGEAIGPAVTAVYAGARRAASRTMSQNPG